MLGGVGLLSKGFWWTYSFICLEKEKERERRSGGGGGCVTFLIIQARPTFFGFHQHKDT